jgi:hypothetical protein
MKQLNTDNTEAKKVFMQQVSLAKYESVSTVETEDRKGWVAFGIKNDYPQYLIDLAQDVPTHGALITGIAQMIAGKRLNGDAAAMADIKRLNIDAQLPFIAWDLKTHGGYYLEITKTLDRRGIARVEHYSYETVRLSYNPETGDVNGYWYSRDWSDIRKKRNTPVFIAKYDHANEDCVKGMMHSFVATPGTQYYPKPDYISSLKYIELARQISVFHLNQIENGLFPSFVVQFNNGQPTEEKAHEMTSMIERNISGAKNAGKAIILFNDNKDEAATFEPFPIQDADKQYQFLSDEVDKKTFIGHRVTTPLLFGIRDSSGLGSNTDEMKQGLEIFMDKVIKPYRKLITDDIAAILQMDGIAATVEIIDEEPTATTLEHEKKKCCLSAEDKLTKEDEAAWIEWIENKGETIDSEEWELVDEQPAHDDFETEDEAIKNWKVEQAHELASAADYANGNDKSEEDVGLYKLRYAYAGELSDNSREFCRKALAATQRGLVWRLEDITDMSEAGVNGQFAPQGQSTYDIFQWKGGVYCGHYWKRQIYFRKRAGGKFLPNDGLKNDKRVGNVPYVRQKGSEAIKPIDTPSRGSLKYS